MSPTATRRATLATAAALFFPMRAGAQELGRFRYAWVRGEGAERCPDAPAIAREVTRRLGRDPFVASGAPSIEASVQRVGTTWTARLIVRDADDHPLGAREFTSEAADCAPIAEAITLGVALSIDPEATLRPPAPTPAPTPPTVATPSVARPATETPWVRRGGVSGRFVVASGLLPGAVAPSAAIAAEGPIAGRFRWSAGLMYFPDEGLVTPGRSYAFGLVAGWAGLCVDAVRATRLALSFCAGGDVGALRAVVLQGSPSTVGERPWGALFAGPRLRGRLAGPLTGELGAELTIPLVRDRYFERERSDLTAFQQSNVAGVAFAGLGLQFP